MSEIQVIKGELPTRDNPLPNVANQQLCASLRAGGLLADRLRRGDFKASDTPALKSLQTEVEASLTPITQTELASHLERLFAHYPQVVMTDSQLEGRWGDWFDDLGNLPADIIAAGCRDWRRSSERFAPTPGQLLDKTEPYMASRVFVERMIRKVIKELGAT